MIETAIHENVSQELAQKWDLIPDEIDNIFERAITAGKHNEFYCISENIHLPLEIVRSDVITAIKAKKPSDPEQIIIKVKEALHLQ